MDNNSLPTRVDLRNTGYITHSRAACVSKPEEGEQQVGFRLGMSLTDVTEDLTVDERRGIQEAFSHAVVSRLSSYYPGLLTCEGPDKAPIFPKLDWEHLKGSGGAATLADTNFQSKVPEGGRAWSEDDVYSLELVDKGSGDQSARIKFLFDWNEDEAKVSKKSTQTRQTGQIMGSIATLYFAVGAAIIAAHPTAGPVQVALGATAATILGTSFAKQTAEMLSPGHTSFSASDVSSGTSPRVSDRAREQIKSLLL